MRALRDLFPLEAAGNGCNAAYDLGYEMLTTGLSYLLSPIERAAAQWGAAVEGAKLCYLQPSRYARLTEEPEFRQGAQDDGFFSQWLMDGIDDLMKDLTYREREAIKMRVEADLTFREIGKVFGISAPGACARYMSGIRKLRARHGEQNLQFGR